MNAVQWISFVVMLFYYGDAGDIPTNGTLYAPGSPCLTIRQNSSSGALEHYNGFCYWHSGFSFVSWRQADMNCRSTGSHLVSIHSLEELNFIRRLVQGNTVSFWIGLRASGLYGSYIWSDGTPVDFVNWEDGDSGSGRLRISMCVSLNPTNGYFLRTRCYNNHLYICKARDELDVPTTVTSASSSTTTVLPEVCPDGWRTYGDKCYAAFGLVRLEMETWHGANQKCLDMGATLVSIHSTDEQDFLFRMMSGKTERSWIGFHEVPTSSDRAFHWTDSSPVDFVYWDTNQPNNWNDYKEECGNMRFDSPHFGRWNDAECILKQSYVCQMHIDPKMAKFPNDTEACALPKGWIKLGSSCYNIFKGPGNNMKWLEAEYFCGNYGGNLVTVRDYRNLAFLRFHLADLQGEFWIGLKNARSNATYAWTTGRVEFSNWNRGQPYEFPDQPNCVVTNPNGRWLVRSCDENHPFICEVDEGTPTPGPEQPTGAMTCPSNSQKWKDYGTSSCYIIELDNRTPWYEAAHLCFQEGGFLASFHSIEDVNAVINQIKDYKDPLYIGLGQTHDGDFVWDDRSVVDFANWHSGQPSSTSQMCVEMLSASGKWNDISCEIQRGYVCSVPKVFTNATVAVTKESKTTEESKIPDTEGSSGIGVGGVLGIVLFFLISVIVLAGTYCCLYPRKRVRTLSQSELYNEEL